MFYSHLLLTKKGPLAKVWLAAHWESKITKAQVFETNLSHSVEAIIRPQVRISLRTSGHLLLGVVKLHRKKAHYLLSDCNDAIIGIKMAYRPDIGVDLPLDVIGNRGSAVTLQEIDLSRAMVMMEGDNLFDDELDYHQARKEDITMPDFDEIPFKRFDWDEIRSWEVEEIRDEGIENIEGIINVTGADGEPSKLGMPLEPPSPRNESATRLKDDVKKSGTTRKCVIENEPNVIESSSFEFSDAPLSATVNLFSNPQTPAPPVIEDVEMEDVSERSKANDRSAVASLEDALVLQPIDVTQMGTLRKARRKRRLIIDEVKSLTSEVMKKNFANTSDILMELNLAPPTKSLMTWRGFTCEKMMEMPVRFMPSTKLLTSFQKRLPSMLMAGKNETRAKKNADAVAEVLNQPLVITSDDVPESMDCSIEPLVASEVIRLSLANGNVADMSADDLPSNNQSLSLNAYDVERVTKENRNTPIKETDDSATWRTKAILRPSLVYNSPAKNLNSNESPMKTPSRNRKTEEPLSRRVAMQNMATPKTSRDGLPAPSSPTSLGPYPYHTPRKRSAFDVSFMDSPLSTKDRDEEMDCGRISVQKENHQMELMDILRANLAKKDTFKNLLLEMEMKTGKQLTRRKAASAFHALLELKKKGSVSVCQTMPYGDIMVSSTL